MPDTPAVPPGMTVIHRESVESTNDVARGLADAGAAHGTVVWADEQTKGRGRRGRAWTSPKGNLYSSFIFRPEKAPSDAAQISFVAAVALAEVLASRLPAHSVVSQKWPNDVLVNNAKISGILVESAGGAGGGPVDWVVLGCGVNIVAHPPDTPYAATDMREAGNYSDTAATLLPAFASALMKWYETWRVGGFAPIRTAWLARAKGLGKTVIVRTQNTEQSGCFNDLDDDGALLLGLEDGSVRRVTAGDVFA